VSNGPGDGVEEPPVLGRDPFAPGADDALWHEALDDFQHRVEDGRRRPQEPARASGLATAWLPAEERARLQELRARLALGPPDDELSADVIERAYPLLFALYRFWFRVESEGHAHLPDGPAILVANHGGLLPFDGAMLAMDVLRHTHPPRVLRVLVARFVERLPGVRTLFARTGQVIGTRERFRELLARRELVGVFPEGVEGITKLVPDRYALRHFHPGFIDEALRAGVPVIPVGIVGPEDQAPMLYDVTTLARRLGLPAFPITPTFPWLGPLGLIPYPVRYRIRYGEPLEGLEGKGPEAAEDTALVEELAGDGRRRVQHLVDALRD
jgi:1-acyl-sn-glycerol-3-phosphate acyltransferase